MNTNFISNKMNARTVYNVFEFSQDESKALKTNRIKKLITDGYIQNHGQYYIPTTKLLEEAFLPKTIILTKNHRRFLNDNDTFAKDELIRLFGNVIIVDWLKLNGYLRTDTAARWRRTIMLSDLLMDGTEEIQTK